MKYLNRSTHKDAMFIHTFKQQNVTWDVTIEIRVDWIVFNI